MKAGSTDILSAFKRIIFSGITTEHFTKCNGKTAGIAEPYHIGNLCHRILSTLHKGKALVGPIFFQEFCNCLSGHLFKQTAAYLS